jgi:hypothetical protein
VSLLKHGAWTVSSQLWEAIIATRDAKCSAKEAKVGDLTMEAFFPKTKDQIEAIPTMEN